jgi:type II secretory pathway component PulL
VDAKGRPRKIWRKDIEATLQQHGLTINDVPRQAKARILKIPQHQISREQQHPLSLVIEWRIDDNLSQSIENWLYKVGQEKMDVRESLSKSGCVNFCHRGVVKW